MRWWDIPTVHAIEQVLFPVDPWTVDMFWSELAGVPATREVIVAECQSGSQNENESLLSPAQQKATNQQSTEHSVIAGYASLRIVGEEADINTIAVAPEYQSCGLGRTMYRYLETIAKDRQVRVIYLDVRADNDVAHNFYKSEGFEDIDIRRNYYESTVDAIVMRKKL